MANKEPGKYFSENRIWTYLFIIGVLIWIIFLSRFTIIGGVSVAEIDEIPYFNSSKVFAERFTLKSTGIIEENISKVTESDWYGPAYPLFFGSFRLIFLSTDKAFIYTNFLLIILTLIILRRYNIQNTDKKWLYLLILFCPSIINYAFLYMPVILDLAIACLLSFLLLGINTKFPKEKIVSYGFIYLAAVLMAGIFKQSFIFFALGILVYSKNVKWFLIWLAGIIFVFLILIIYGKYFLAAPYSDNLKSLDYLYQLKILDFINNNRNNFFANLLEFKSKTAVPIVYFAPYYLVLLPALTLILNLKQKSRLVFAMILISGATLFTYLAFYTTMWNYFVRISIPLVFINCLTIIFFKEKIKTFFKFAILLSFILSLPFSVKEIIKIQNIKKSNYDYINDKMPDFKRITLKLDDNKINTILIDSAFYNIYGFEQFLMALPLEKGDNIVRYTVNYRLANKYTLLGKIKVDFALTPKPENIPNTSLVEHTDYYYLYKFNN